MYAFGDLTSPLGTPTLPVQKETAIPTTQEIKADPEVAGLKLQRLSLFIAAISLALTTYTLINKKGRK